MATLTPGYTFTSGEVITPAKLNSAASPTLAAASITNSDISATAAIADSKLATIITPGKVSGAALSGDIATGNVSAAGNVSATGRLSGRLSDGTLNLVSSAVTITSANPGVVTWTGHTLQNGDRVEFSTTGALPTALVAATEYYVVNAATNTFQVSATLNGTAIDTAAGTQSGTHTATFGRAVMPNAFVTTAKIADGSITTSKLAGNVDQLATAWVLFDGDIADSAVAGAVFTRLTSTRIKVTRSTGHNLSNGNWITFMPTSTVTISQANPALITWTGHALEVGQTVTFSTTGTLPAGLTAGTTYFVKAVTAGTTFQVSLTSGGTAIATTSAGSGVHTATLTGGSNPFGVFSGFYAFLNGTWEVQNATATEFEFEISGATTPTSTVTISQANPALITWTGHALAVGQTVTFSTTGTLPTGLTAGTTYFVKVATAGTTFQVSLTSGGTAIATTSAGSGVHTATLTGTMTSQIFSPVAILRKYNVSKIARTALGRYRIFFQTQPLTVDYISFGSASDTTGDALGLVGTATQTTQYADIITTNSAGTNGNYDKIRLIVFGG